MLTTINQIRTEEPIRCVKCNNSWLEEVSLRQFRRHMMVLGQKFHALHGGDGFVVLKCNKCGHIMLPEIEAGPINRVWKAFESMIKELGLEDNDIPVGG